MDDRFLADRLISELDPDPLDGLRALHDGLYLDLDRERAEREVRLSMALPSVALGVMAAAQFSGWWIGLAIIGTMSLVRNSLRRSGERGRILNLIHLKQILTPAMLDAGAAGRDDVRAHLLDVEELERKRTGNL